MSSQSSTYTRVGKVLAGRYLLTERLAVGGMAEVWLADDQVLGRRVAVKMLHHHLAGDPVFVERFRGEAKVAARLSHPGVVSIFDTVSEPGLEAIVMELLEGVDLRAFLDDNGPLSAEMTRELGAQVADAIAAAHQAGLVHRDIKPGNIMLIDDQRTKVTDFGIAKPDGGTDLTDHGTLIGTAKYLAPEQVRGGPVDARADLYALGIVLFECLTGQVPFRGDGDVATAVARLDRSPPHVRSFRSTVPPSLDAVVHRAMALDPDDRYQSAAELRAALLAADDATVITDATMTAAAPATTAPEATEFIASERRWMVPTALIVVVGVTLAVAGALLGTTEVGRDAVTRAREAVGLAHTDREPLEQSLTGNATATDGQRDDGEPATVTAVSTFDPDGVGAPGENDEAVGSTIDGDPTTSWTTESYDTRAFGGLKSGVGLIIELDREAPLHRVNVDSPSVGWSASIHVAPTAADDITGWGSPITTVDDIAGSFRVDIDGAPRAGAILLWITDLGDGPPRVRVQIDEITVEAG